MTVLQELRPPALGNVSEGDDGSGEVVLAARRSDLEMQRLAVAPAQLHRNDLPARSVLFGCLGDHPGEPRPAVVASHEVGQTLTACLCLRPSEQPLRGRIPGGHAAGGVDRDGGGTSLLEG